MQSKVVKPNGGEVTKHDGWEATVKIGGDETDGSLTVLETRHDPCILRRYAARLSAEMLRALRRRHPLPLGRASAAKALLMFALAACVVVSVACTTAAPQSSAAPGARATHARGQAAGTQEPFQTTAALDPGTVLAAYHATLVALHDRSPTEDLKAIMEHVGRINATKEESRQTLAEANGAAAGEAAGLDHEVARALDEVGKVQQAAEAASPFLSADGSVADMNQARAEKTALFSTTDAIKRDLESMSEMGETESLRLQMAMERK